MTERRERIRRTKLTCRLLMTGSGIHSGAIVLERSTASRLCQVVTINSHHPLTLRERELPRERERERESELPQLALYCRERDI